MIFRRLALRSSFGIGVMNQSTAQEFSRQRGVPFVNSRAESRLGGF